MKHPYILALSALLLASCGKQQGGNEATDSTEVKTTTEATVEEKAEEAPIVYSLQTETCSDYKMFEFKSLTKNIYHENSITIEWPKSAEGIDLAKLQEAYKEWLHIDKNKDVRKYLKEWVENERSGGAPDMDFVPCKERHERDEAQMMAAEAGEEDEFEYQYDTEQTLSSMLIVNDSIHHYLVFQMETIDNIGNGVGAGVYQGFSHFVYDYERGERINLKDIVKDEKAVVKQLKKQNKGSYEGLPNVTSIPSAWYISGKNLCVIFPKYEIGYGSDGCPELGIDLTKCIDALTDYGKKLIEK